MSIGNNIHTSMTYHEWLIGTIAAGVAANPAFAESSPRTLVAIAVHSADNIIAHLDGKYPLQVDEEHYEMPEIRPITRPPEEREIPF